MTLTSDPAPFTEEDHEMQLKAKKKLLNWDLDLWLFANTSFSQSLGVGLNARIFYTFIAIKMQWTLLLTLRKRIRAISDKCILVWGTWKKI